MITVWIIVPLLLFVVGWWRPALAVALFAFLWPSYLLRTEVAFIPTTLLELSLYAGVAGTLIALVTKRLPWSWPKIQPTVILWLGAWSVAWTIATIASPDQRASLGALKAWWLDPLLYGAWLWLTVRDAIDRQTVMRFGLLSGTIIAVAGLFQLVFVRESLQAGRLSSFYAPVANYAAMLLGPLFVTGLAWLSQKALPKVWWFFLGLIGAALLATVSYGGFLAVAAGSVIIWAYLPSAPNKKRLLWTGLALAGLFVLVLSLTPNFREHFNFGRSSSSVRKEIWVTSWALIQQHPLVGIGPNAFETAYRAELPKHYFPPLEWLVSQPHNLYLALWLELGLLGFLSFVVGAAWLIRTMIWSAKSSANRGLVIGSLAGLVVTLVHGLVDTPILKNDLVLMTVWIMLLPWLGQSTSRPQTKNK